MGAAAVYFIFQAVMAAPLLKNYTWSLDHQDPGFRQMVRLAVPTLISGSIVQVNTIILTGFADQFPGAATSLRNAATTWQLPYGIFVVAIGNVMLPSLARHHAALDETGSSQLFGQSLRQALFLMIPSAALILALQKDVIQAIFQWSSSYTAEQVATAASVLRWYALAMIAQTFVFLTNQAFYARKMTRVALVNGLLTLVLNPMLCLVLFKGFRMDISGLSLAYTLTSIASAIFLFRTYAYVAPQATPRHLSGYLLRLMAAASAMMVLLLFLNRIGYVPQGKVHELIWLFIRSTMSLLVFIGVAVLLHVKEASNLLATVHSRISALLGLSKKRD